MFNLVEALHALKTGDTMTRVDTARSMGLQGPAAAAAVPALIEALHDHDEVSSTAAWALGRIGQAAIAAVPTLVHLGQSLERRQDIASVVKRTLLLQALVDLRSPAVIPLLRRAILEEQGGSADLLQRTALKFLAVMNRTPTETSSRPFRTC